MERRDFIKATGAAGAFFVIATPESLRALAEGRMQPELENSFINPLRADGPWVVWHWTNCNQTKEGVTSNLEAMAATGIAGATLFSFPPGNGTVVENPAAPLTPEWFDLVNHAVTEAGRLGITLAVQISAGWATAGGSWIPPELSQQQIVWSELTVDGGKPFRGKLARPKRPSANGQTGRGGEYIPQSWNDYYRDLNVLAFPIPWDWEQTNINCNAKITTNLPVTNLAKLVDPNNTEIVLITDQAGWIQFAFDQPFTLRTVTINPGGYNRPAHSMELQASEDGVVYRRIRNLEPMISGWQTNLPVLSHTVPQTTARFFRLIYNPGPPLAFDRHARRDSWPVVTTAVPKEGTTQSGTESINILDLIDRLALASIELSSTARVHNWEGKTALVWGRSRRIISDEMPDSTCVPLDSITDLTDLMDEDGSINWQPPEGKWKIMRFGYTTMARTNGSGIGQGLEADKFSADGARIAFEGWYGRILEHVGPRLTANVVKMLNVDSWECGSQNWSPVFRDEFSARRGYDLTKYLPLMAGVPVESADVTEGFLFDVRRTIADLISDNFFGTLNKFAHAKGSLLNTEAVCPTMMSDGMLVHKNVDVTCSEFWADTWHNWKPCDIREATSAAHIYGKQIVMAEAYTGGGHWTEHPYDLKVLGDLHFADGINRFMIHLWAAQPFPRRKPGVTGAAGTYFNEHTTWIKPGRAWVEYLRRCQSLLQTGITVCDALYFIGEEVPCRALIPPHYGSYYVTEPALPEGYNYDSINQDALLNHAGVKNGMIVLPSGVSYRVLVMHPDRLITPQLANKIRDLVAAGAQVVGPKPLGSPSLEMYGSANAEVKAVADDLWGNMNGVNVTERVYGSGRIFWGMSLEEVFERIGVEPDLLFLNQRETLTGNPYKATAFEPQGINPTALGSDRKGWGLRWNHRTTNGYDFYFISNQEQMVLSAEVSFNITGRIPELWHADTGMTEDAPVWREENGRIIIPMEFDPAGSVFIMFRRSSEDVDQVIEVTGGQKTGGSKLKLKVMDGSLERWASENGKWNLKTKSGQNIAVNASGVPVPVPVEGDWDITFPLLTGVTKQVKLRPGSWTEQADEDIKYFSGTAIYAKDITLTEQQLSEGKKLYLDLGEVKNLAEVKVNGKNLGVVWKPPYRVNMTDVAATGVNRIEIEVTNTWHNRLARDAELLEEERQTWVLGGNVRAGAALVPGGLLGPVEIKTMVRV
ncbi:MAG: twin-arginine translocation signal domain-containing protein [Bacteroidales bacterium]|nr:twin-arginine translocation signal domain-containing protein [Bacteroidales bacterium]